MKIQIALYLSPDVKAESGFVLDYVDQMGIQNPRGWHSILLKNEQLYEHKLKTGIVFTSNIKLFYSFLKIQELQYPL